MKKIFYFFLVLVALSSCALVNLTSVYSVSNGKVNVPQKESYRVVYRASFSRELVADAAYTDGNGNQVELKEISGNWEKTVILKSGTHAQLTTFAKAKTDARGEYKIMVDGKVVSEYILTGKRLKYNFDFDLP